MTIAWDWLVLTSLEEEFAFGDAAKTDETIRARLKRKKLGAFDVAKVAECRRLKNFLQHEVGKQEKSRYWLGMTGRSVAMTDFDVARLTSDCIAEHPRLTKAAIRQFVPRAVFLYHVL